MRVKNLAQEHNAMTRPGLEPEPLDPESRALTTRPPRLPQWLWSRQNVINLTFVLIRVNGVNVYQPSIACGLV